MRKLFILLIIASFNFLSCKQNYNEVQVFFGKNELILNEIVEFLISKKYFEKITVQNQSLIYNYTNIYISLDYKTSSKFTVEGNNFSGISEKYFDKIKYFYNNEDVSRLTRILYFMYENNIEMIATKIPDIDFIFFYIGYDQALAYKINREFEANVNNAKQIRDNWYLVDFKFM